MCVCLPNQILFLWQQSLCTIHVYIYANPSKVFCTKGISINVFQILIKRLEEAFTKGEGGKRGIPEMKITAASLSELSSYSNKSLEISLNENIKTTKNKP